MGFAYVAEAPVIPAITLPTGWPFSWPAPLTVVGETTPAWPPGWPQTPIPGNQYTMSATAGACVVGQPITLSTEIFNNGVDTSDLLLHLVQVTAADTTTGPVQISTDGVNWQSSLSYQVASLGGGQYGISQNVYAQLNEGNVGDTLTFTCVVLSCNQTPTGTATTTVTDNGWIVDFGGQASGSLTTTLVFPQNNAETTGIWRLDSPFGKQYDPGFYGANFVGNYVDGGGGYARIRSFVAFTINSGAWSGTPSAARLNIGAVYAGGGTVPMALLLYQPNSAITPVTTATWSKANWSGAAGVLLSTLSVTATIFYTAQTFVVPITVSTLSLGSDNDFVLVEQNDFNDIAPGSNYWVASWATTTLEVDC